MMGKKYAIAGMLLGVMLSADGVELKISSPDGRNEIGFSKDVKGLRYELKRDGEMLVGPSRAGLQIDNRVWEMALGKRDLEQPQCWMDLLTVDSVTVNAPVDSVWHPLYGERSAVRDRFNSATLHMSRKDKSNYRLDVEVRAYDEGVAFRYFFPEHPAAIFHKVTEDLTDYTFPEGTMAWSEQWAQAFFDYTPVDSIKRPVERALTLKLPGNRWVALLDADVDDWCLTKLQARSDKNGTLQSVMYSPVDIVTYYATPWKIIMTADSPGELLENNDIVLNLNPRHDGDFAWVKPGKIMRSPISTEMGLKTIDFCADHNIQYMLYDWQWYMPCTSHDGDATKVVDKVDMQRVIDYGKEKGVGVWLYVNQHALMKQMDELFPLLRQWGVAGVKSGFVQYASHRWATWLHDMVRRASDNGLMMNIHDEFRPSGFSRTYPNLLTQEGICGNEEFPDATHNVILPFTRMLNGAADYTICYYDKRLKNTHAHQLAASLVFYSPLQTIFWYDNPTMYGGEPEVKWFEDLVTTFDESRVLSGYPGKGIVMARRNGDTWWVGAMANNEGGEVEINLDFLDPAGKYMAEIYTDGGEKVKTRTHVKIENRKVSTKDKLKFRMEPRGGVAIRIAPRPEMKK
jgi:alpha-glucosidase